MPLCIGKKKLNFSFSPEMSGLEMNKYEAFNHLEQVV